MVIEKDDESSYISMAKIYLEKNNIAEAKKLYEKAAQKKDALAIFNLFKIYYSEKNYEEAEKWRKMLLEEKMIYGLKKI